MTDLSHPVIKVCGVRNKGVLEAAIRAGATAIGLNFVPTSRRKVDLITARQLKDWGLACGAEAIAWVGVFANTDSKTIERARGELGLDAIQLHGSEEPKDVGRIPGAFKAVRLSSSKDFEQLRSFPGEYILIDAFVPNKLGGTGRRIPMDLVEAACRIRPVVVAGGLNHNNVTNLIETARPAGVDTASGAEDDQGRPCPKSTQTFVERAKQAFGNLTVGQ